MCKFYGRIPKKYRPCLYAKKGEKNEANFQEVSTLFIGHALSHLGMGTSINDVPRFLAIFDLPTLSYSITSDLGGYLGPLDTGQYF